jgi:hypothetical protein
MWHAAALGLDRVEVMVSQTHLPGAEAEVDFGEFHAAIAGTLLKLWMFVMRLSCSGRAFHVAEPGDVHVLVAGGEAQQQPDGVPVAAHRRRAQPLDGDQVVGEEGVDERPERPRPGHHLPSVQAGCAKASKRRPASTSSCGVMVR